LFLTLQKKALSQVNTTLDGVTLKLSNLDKILWPETGISKAELIQYYLKVYPIMQAFINRRPLTLIRYPEGIHGNKFYSKNAPEHTPDWIPQSLHSDISYIHIQKSADLIYLANLASLEIHAMTHTTANPGKPDCMIFDLDPTEGFDFSELKNICSSLYTFTQALGYHPHIKTSGSKGLHIYIPILPNYTQDQVFATTKLIGQKFIESHPQCTLKISKEQRVGKILIDIYRNHQSQTCIAALSTRAKEGAPVSMPIVFEDLAQLRASNQFNIRNAFEYLEEKKPWANFFDLASRLHTDIDQSVNLQEDTLDSEPSVLNTPSNTSLEDYNKKRDFSKTSEPKLEEIIVGTNNRYTMQLHDATNLHYDLRLEENGVLTSWAIPKSLPTLQGIKRLAIKTEDHPIKYLDFEGIIPQGEYGGGRMWIYDKGNYEIIKKTPDAYRIKLFNGLVQGEFSIFHTKDNHWIVELKSDNKQLSIQGFMLAEQTTTVPSEDFIFELKWDGIRASITKQGDAINIWSKSGRDITSQFPEIVQVFKNLDVEVAHFDGEIVCLDSKGIPVFANVISRMHTKSFSTIQASIKSNPAVFYVFDIRNLDGKDCTSMPLFKRQEFINLLISKSEYLRVSDVFEDGQSLFDAAKSMGLEGIMAKRKNSTYQVNKRSKDWLKIKVRTLIDVEVIGYTKGKGDRAALLGSLHIANREEETIKYLGKVGTGFDETKLNEIYTLLASKPVIQKPIKDAIEEESSTIWIGNGPIIEVQYASMTPNGTLREPVFFRIKDDDE
jgi:bifunctional non-homologous end joining protein LigD